MGTAFELDLQEGLVCLVKGWWQEVHKSGEEKRSRGKGWEGEASTFFVCSGMLESECHMEEFGIM